MNATSHIDTLQKSDDWKARRDAAEALGELRDPSAFDALVFALKNDAEFPVRFRAAEAISMLGLAEGVPVLLEAIGPNGDSSNTVVAYAAKALGSMHLPETVEPMINVLREKLKSYREGQDYTAIDGIADGLGKIGAAAVPLLLESLGRREMVSEVLQALEPIGDPSAESALLSAASDIALPAYVRAKAVRGLGNIQGATSGEALSALLSSASDESLIIAINRAMEKIGYEASAELAEEAKRRAAEKLLSGLRSIRPGMSEEAADKLVGGAVFGMGANQVHKTQFGDFQLLVVNGIVTGSMWVDSIITKIEEYLGGASQASPDPPASSVHKAESDKKGTKSKGVFAKLFKRTKD